MYLHPGKVLLFKENVAPLKQGRHWSVDVGCDSCWLLRGPELSLGLGEVYSPQ